MANNSQSNQNSALSSIASTYSDSEDSDGEEPAASFSSLGGLVASLRTQPGGEEEDKAESEKTPEKVTKIVRLDSGKVVKIQVSSRSSEKGDESFGSDKTEESFGEKVDASFSKDAEEIDAVTLEETKEETNEPERPEVSEESLQPKDKIEENIEILPEPMEVDSNISIEEKQAVVEKEELTEDAEKKERKVVIEKEKDKEEEDINATPGENLEKKESPAKEIPKVKTLPLSVDVSDEKKEVQKPPKDKPATKSLETLSPEIKKQLSISPKSSPVSSELSPKMISKPSEISPKPSPDTSSATLSSPDDGVKKPVKVLPPLPNLEKIKPKSVERAKTGPVKLKRSIDLTPTKPMDLKKPKVETSPTNTSEEIREILSKRLGSGLDISILPSKSGTSPEKVSSQASSQAKPSQVKVKRSPEVPRPPVEPKRITPEKPAATEQVPSISKHLPPQTPYQQRLALAQQSYQASFANLLRSPPLPISQPQRKVSPVKFSPPEKQVVPGIVIRKMEGDGQRKVLPAGARNTENTASGTVQQETKEKITMRVMSHAAEGSKGPLSMKITSKPDAKIVEEGSSSGSDVQKYETSSSSQENSTSLPGADIDFEKMIGSSMLAKEDGHEVEQTPPPTPMPRKRGRPRKLVQTPLVDPNPLVATWPPEGQEGSPATSTPGRSKRQRNEAAPTFLLPKRRRKKMEKKEAEGNKDSPKQEGTEKTDEGSEDDDSKAGDNDSKVDEEENKLDADFTEKGPKVPRKKKRRRGPFYVKRKPRIYDPNKKKKEKENFQNFEEETRMSASEGLQGDESMSSSINTEGTRNTGNKKGRMEIVTEGIKPITVQQIVEYPWPPAALLPPGEKPEHYMIQEQITEYLGVKSFKRKYPNIKRRAVDMEERNYLQENGYVTENMCDMGLTAVESADIMEIMFNDFPNKFDEYRKFSRERKQREQKALREKQAAERADMDPRQEALESVSTWNAEFNKTRQEKRSHYFDLQSFTVNVPRKGTPIDPGRVGYYPLAIVSGQNTDYYKEYTPAELKYFPLNTVIYGPMRPNERHPHEMEGSDGSGSDSYDSSSSDDSSSSSSDDTRDSSSSECEEVDPTFSVQQTTPRITRPVASTTTPKARVRLAVKLEKMDLTTPVKLEPIKEVKEPKESKEVGPRKCKKCGGDEERNKDSVYERLITCSFCRKFWHPSCLSMSAAMVCRVESYKWQCSDCKLCVRCQKPNDASKMIFCDNCDRGHHIFCIGLQSVPIGTYICSECTPSKPTSVEVKAEKLEQQLAMQINSAGNLTDKSPGKAKNDISVK